MFDTPIEEMREGISHSSREIIWAQHEIDPAYFSGDIGEILEHAWHEVAFIAAKNILGMINDGELYCIRVKRFKRNFDFVDIELPVYPLYFPKVSIGYKGSISRVRVEPYLVVGAHDFDHSFYGSAFDLTWGQIKRNIIRRLKNDFKPNSLVSWFIKNILGRLLYLPNQAPDFWGEDLF